MPQHSRSARLISLPVCRAKLGVAAAFLPVLNYVLLKFSRHVAHQLVSAGYEVSMGISRVARSVQVSQRCVQHTHLHMTHAVARED